MTKHTNEGQTMTFEEWANSEGFWMRPTIKSNMHIAWQSCAAQSAETIARLEEENRRLNDVVINQTIYSAAAQLDNERLREAIEKVQCDISFDELADDTIDSTYSTIAQPLDTSALDAYVASKIEHITDGVKQQLKLKEDALSELRSKKFARFHNEECWIYQGDGTDNLESLVCPVVISPKALMEMQAKVDALVPEGWKVVPTEPTKEMILAGADSKATQKAARYWMGDAYTAMLNAAPLPPSPNTQGVE